MGLPEFFKTKVFRPGAWAFLAVSLVSVAGTVYGYGTLNEKVEAVKKEAVKAAERAAQQAIVPRVEHLERGQSDLKDEVREMRKDVQGVYLFLATGQRQDRLEAPIDGGSK